MQRRLGNVIIEVTGAESPKFTAPLLLLHGLWCTAEVWRRWTGFLAHRGWTCHAVAMRSDAGAPADWAEYQQRVANVIVTFEVTPVVIGHDLGGLLALRAAPRARAVVALAPHLPRSLRGKPATDLIATPGLPFRLWQRSLALPRRRRRQVLGDPQLQRVSEPLTLIRSLMQDDRTIDPTSTPTLLVIGGRDPFVARASVEQVAKQIGAAILIAETAGHALPVEPGWEQRVNDVHRWLIKTLGDPLLALREDSEE